MRYLILSDVHANLEALEAVLAAAAETGYDRVLVLGDLVGYGADPNAVVDRVRTLNPAVMIRGNHDKVAAGLEDSGAFNFLARQAADWTRAALTPENRALLERLAAGPALVSEGIEVCHGAPYDEDAYVFESRDAARALDAARRPVCLYGHTHLPAVFIREGDSLDAWFPDPDAPAVIHLRPEARYLINPGAVGQPRDGDPRAAFGLLDEERQAVSIRRVAYPLAVTQRKILASGLPAHLAKRLAVGR